jgi:DNA-directed RNA polymerase specialized sigma24 family protein
MKEKPQITQEDFDNLLGWFSADADEAGRKYEEIRQGLIRFFRFRGCTEAEDLADETFNRIAQKLEKIKFDDNIKLITYFYSFASNIYLEDFTKRKRNAAKTEDIISSIEQKNQIEEIEKSPAIECLEKCLTRETPETRSLLLEYYSREKNEKIELRKKLAEEQNVNIQSLHTRVFRLKKNLRKCLKNCLAKKKL